MATTKDRIVAALLHHQSPATLLADQVREALVSTPKTNVVGPVDQLVEALTAGQRTAGRMTLQEIADAVSLQPPTVLAHLRRLCQEGRVNRVKTPASHSPTYEAAPYFAASWCDPQRSILLNWHATTRIDWQYPLATRVPYAAAQRVLSRLLPQLDKAINAISTNASPATTKSAPNLGLYAYGSAARGDARPGSDLDLLLVSFAPSASRVKGAVTKVIRSANLWAEMPIDIRIVEVKDLLSAPPPFLQTLAKEGVTIHWWGGDPFFVEAEPFRTILANSGTWQSGGSS